MTPRDVVEATRVRRRVLFVSPHFPPDSSAASHRARILVPHLAKFGWDAVVLTVDQAAIEGRPDLQLLASIPDSIPIIRAAVTPLGRARAAGVGDLGIRALRGLYAEGRRLLARERFDAVLITTYPIYPAWLGPRFKAISAIPFVLDLQDPWVGAWGRSVGPGGRPDLRSRLSRRVAVALERSIAPRADAVVAVSSGTLEELAARVPAVRTRPLLELPIGWEPADFQFPRTFNASTAPPATIMIRYVGTLLPAGHDMVRALLAGAAELLGSSSAPPIHLQFIGTSNQTKYTGPPLVARLIPSGIEHAVHEQPERLPYFEALGALTSADVVLVLGTREPHYTASKLYPALASGKPVFALLHEGSQGAEVLRGATGVALVTFDGATTLDELKARTVSGLRQALALVGRAPFDRATILDGYRGEALASQLAQLLETVALHTQIEAHA